VVFFGVAYFTTFAPSPDAPEPGTDPCYVGEGTARLYELGYKTATAMFNLDLTNDISGTTYGASDRSQVIGTAIPQESSSLLSKTGQWLMQAWVEV